MRRKLIGLALLAWSLAAGATELTIQLSGSQPISRKTVEYQCDAQGAATGLPAAAFPVEYINGAGNSLVTGGKYPLDSKRVMQRIERHQRDGRGAIGIRDDSLVVLQVRGIDFGNDQRDIIVHSEGA